MKNIIVVAAIFIGTHCLAQDSFFQIITFQGDVKLDSLPVTCGQKIDDSHRLLLVGKASYISILTSRGYAFQLGKGKHKIKNVLKLTSSNLARIKSSYGMGAVHRSYPDAIHILSMRDAEYSYLAGDSITVIWQKHPNNTYSFTLTDVWDKILLDTLVSGNTVSVPINLTENKALLFQVKSGKLFSPQMLVKASLDQEDFAHDASCPSSLSFIDRELLLAGLCEIYNLYYDQVYHLYNLYTYSRKTGTKISHPYYHRMLKEHEFEKFLTVNR